MHPIQIVLLAGILFSIIMLFCGPKKQILGRLFFLVQFLVGIVFVLFPDISTRVGRRLGVGRGTDLILYFMVILFYVSTMLFIRKLREIERRQTEILREITLLKDKHEN